MTVASPYIAPWHAPELNDSDMTSRQRVRVMEISLETYLSGMCGEQVKVRVFEQNNTGPHIRWEDSPQGHWSLVIGSDALTTANVMRIASKMLFTLNKGVMESVTKRLQDFRVSQIATVLESARTEWMGDMWFNSHMLEETRFTMLNIATFKHKQGVDIALHEAVSNTAYGVPFLIHNAPIMQGVIDRFGPEIQKSVRSLDQSVTLNLAIDIGNYLNWRENHEKGEGQSGQSGNPDPQGQGSADGQSSSETKDGQGSGQQGQEANAPTPPKQPPNEADFEADTAADRKRMKTNIKRTVTRRNKKREEVKASESSRAQRARASLGNYNHYPGTNGNKDTRAFRGAHSVEIIDIGGVPTELDAYTKLTLGSFMGNRLPNGQLRRSGTVSPRNAWKLSTKGDTRIFQKPPRTKGHVSILVDISGSMGCCPHCVESYPNDIAAYLAWQVSGLLGQLHPTAEVFAYSGGGSATSKIIPLNAGEQPDGCARRDQLAGGTPTCTAMLYFQDHLKSRPSDTTAIIITDGGPDPCEGLGMPHVDYIGQQMMAEGIKFGTVFIGGGQYLNLPAEVSVNVSSLQDIPNVQPLLESLDS